MKLLMMAASTRKDSINKKLIAIAGKIAQAQNCQVDLADFNDFAVPLYDGDLEIKSGAPKGALKFIKCMQDAKGIVIASPEYNFSTPGTLKNLIDWVSRAHPMPWTNKHILLLSASPSLVGGNRGLWITRIPLEGCGAFVYPDMFSLPSAYDAFDEQGNLVDNAVTERLEQYIGKFIAHIATKAE